ncbi:MAG TPA: amidase family protein, partial [Actinomycetota bacterium]|nr:amidase family protein [Actinomycetota bacterium]
MARGSVGRSAAELAALVRSGEADPVEVVREHLEQISRLEPAVGAFRVVRAERALAEAEAIRGREDLPSLPLAGVPIAVKDNVSVAGEAARQGSEATSGEPAAEDEELVRRLRAAGAVIVGVTRMPEFGLWGTTDGPWGVTRNPWDPTRTAGGSSGGSAAAVAAAMVPAAQGNDGLGSIRIPAACCGVVGIKPGAGVVPAGPGLSAWAGFTENGALATTVGDVALLLSAMSGREDLRDPEPPARPLRVAVSIRPPLAGVRVDPEVRRAVLGLADVLVGAGHRVELADPPYAARFARVIVARWIAAPDAAIPAVDPARLEPRTRRHARIGRALGRLLRPPTEADREAWRARLAPFFRAHDVLLTPVLSGPPLPALPWHRRGWLPNVLANARRSPFAAPWNLAGYPALALPAGRHPTGTPIGAQLVAAAGGEGLLLSLARQGEELRPWPRHAP